MRKFSGLRGTILRYGAFGGQRMPAQDTETVDETRAPVTAGPGASDELQIQPAGFLIVLSLDWIVLRASENIDDFLGESHVTLIEAR